MTAVANAPAFPQLSRSAWNGTISGNNTVNADDVRGMFAPRKNLARSSSSSSISSDSSGTSVATNGSLANGGSLSSTSDLSQWSTSSLQQRKRPQQPTNVWPVSKQDTQQDLSRFANVRPNGMMNAHGIMQQNGGGPQSQMGQQLRPVAAELAPGQPVLYLLSLNGTFERKTIAVPFAPESLRIGRQTNQKTVPTPTNGFFDSKVLSRQHAEIYAERSGKVFIRDVKSSNGTFVNGTRLSQENRESEPHELQTADHLELGIDIVSEDQKTVVHHKVAAKVEHAGFLAASNNVLDMNFGDLDPANGSTMLSGVAMQMRGRNGSNAPVANNGRPMHNAPINQQANNMLQQRPFFMAPIATDQIMKRLTAEMRSARLQAQDLGRTNQFLSTLLSKDDLKELDNHDAVEAQKLQPVTNGSAVPLRPDTKARFSDPPAPPPQQPLPEKPDSPAPKRGLSERPKSGQSLSSPIKQDNLSQIIQLTEALNNAKRDIDVQAARNRELEELLQQERQAREVAEGLARQLEESTTVQVNGSIKTHDQPEDTTKELPVVTTDAPEQEVEQPVQETVPTPSVDNVAVFESRILTMESQMEEMKQQLSQWKQRCEAAETERDSNRKSLEEMVIQLRAEEARRKESEKAAQTKSAVQKLPNPLASTNGSITAEEATEKEPPSSRSSISDDSPTLSRTNTITPQNANMGLTAHGQRYNASLPYASMFGVVLIGMGMMAYMNGWQAPPPPRVDH